MIRSATRATVATAVALSALVLPAQPASAADECGTGYWKTSNGFFERSKNIPSPDGFRWGATVNHAGMVRFCTKDEFGPFNRENARVILGGPWENRRLQSVVKKTGSGPWRSFCVTQTVSAKLTGMEDTTGISVTGGSTGPLPEFSTSFSATNKTVIVSLAPTRSCSVNVDRDILMETGGQMLTSDKGEVEWVEVNTRVNGVYVNSRNQKVTVNDGLQEYDFSALYRAPAPTPTPPPPPPPAPTCGDNDCWRGQLGTQSYVYQPNSDPSDPRLARIVFDRTWYLNAHPDVYTWAQGKVATQGGSIYDHAQWHWLNYGVPQGRIGAATFDPVYYMQNQGDVAAAYGWNNYYGAMIHYVAHGRFEGRRGSSFFDVGHYKARYGDIAAWGNADALDHFTVYGMSEGRQGSADFAPAWYLGYYPDLRNAYGSNNYRMGMSHWISNGRHEGRLPRP